MKTWLCAAACFLGLTSAVLAADPAPQPAAKPGAEVFGTLPLLMTPRLSPDGTYFACMQAYKGRPVVTVTKIGDTSGKWPVILPVQKMIIDDFIWVKNDKLVLRLKWTRSPSGDQETFYHYASVSADGKDAVPLTEGSASSAEVTTDIHHRAHMLSVVDIALDEPDSIYAGMSDGTLARVSLRTGESKLIANPRTGRYGGQWYTDGHGKPVARVDLSYSPLQHHLMTDDGSGWSELETASYEGDSGINLFGVGPDGTYVLTNGQTQSGHFALVRTTITGPDKGKRALFFSVPNYDVGDVLNDEWTRRVIGAYYVTDRPRVEYFDPGMRAIANGLAVNFPNSSFHIVSTDVARSKIFFRVSSPAEPPIFFYLNRATHEAKPIGREYPALSNVALGDMKPYNYAARDGTPIPGYLTLPPGKPASKLPLIVLPHGGPNLRDALDFNWWQQFYATRGYAVFQPNYRGSGGYGHPYVTAGDHEWGLKMQDDVTDGVKKLIAEGTVDPKRICIVGGSYGGYAALAGAAFTPDLYACVVSVNGVSDLPEMLDTIARLQGRESKPYSFWYQRIGDPSSDVDRLKATSPARNAAKVQAPVLLLHSVGDTTVYINQSEIMEAALKKAGKRVEFIRMEGDDHYLELTETRIRMLKESERFIAAAIGN